MSVAATGARNCSSSSLGVWIVTRSGMGLVGPTFPLGSQSSMILTLIPSTPWMTIRNLVRTRITEYRKKCRGKSSEWVMQAYLAKESTNHYKQHEFSQANLSQKNMSHSWVDIFFNRLTRRNHVSILELHGLRTLCPKFSTHNNLLTCK